MPEIAEVARVVHFLRKNLVGKTLTTVQAQDDTIVYGKVGTSGAEVVKALLGKKVLDAGRQGKYFWLIMSSPPHPVFHFGMTGWFYVKGEPAIHYRPKGPKEPESWPPKYWKLSLETDTNPKTQAAFTDARRLARIRLVHCAAEDIRNTTPLKENGPDPTLDQHILTEQWLEKKMLSKRVPVKALLLDQANISGIGNWVGDEILYHAKLHPEQYSNTFTSAQLKQLHTSMLFVCQTAVDLLADSSKFPKDWLFNHRWGKGKKDTPSTLPNGDRITFLTVGGRTSCVIPNVQKKTGTVAADIKTEKGVVKADATEEPIEFQPEKAKTPRKRKDAPKEDESVDSTEVQPTAVVKAKRRKHDPEDSPKSEVEEVKPTLKVLSKRDSTKLKEAEQIESTSLKSTSNSRIKKEKTVKKELVSESTGNSSIEVKSDGRRRSGRISKPTV